MGNPWIKSWNGNMLIVGQVYQVNGNFYTYAGDFQKMEDVPRMICCFTIGDEFRVRHSVPNFNVPVQKVIRRNRPDDDNPINTEIKDTDNSLMVMIKTGLKHKGITRGDFKNSYDKDSDMHNALWRIENEDKLSWDRFTDLCRRFGLHYSLSLYDEVGTIEEIDTGLGEGGTQNVDNRSNDK